MTEFMGVLKRDNSGLYLQSKGTNYRIIMQRMPVDVIKKNVIITGKIEASETDGDIIIAEGVRLDDAYLQSEF